MKISYIYLPLATSLTIYAHAQIPNAGILSREASQTNPITPQTATLPVATPHAITNGMDNSTTITINDFTIQGASQLPTSELYTLVQPAKGQNLTLAQIQQYADKITSYYHTKGYPLALAILPPQQIDNGIVTIQIVEGKLTATQLNNQSRVKDSVVKNYLAQATSQGSLNQGKAEQVLSHIKDLGGTSYVGYQLAEGKNTGESTLIVNLGKVKPIDGHISVDNYGSKSTGEIRTRGVVNLNSPFGYGEQLSAEAMSSFKGVDYARIGATLPAGYQGTKLYTNLSRTNYDLGGDFKDLDATGSAKTFSLGIKHPIKRSNTNSLWFDTNLQYSDLQDNIGSTKTTTDKTSKAVNIGLNGYHQDNFLAGGYTQYGLTNVIGNLSIDSADARAIDLASAKTNGNFYKVSGYLNRTQFLNQKWSILASMTGQWANKNLDSSEQISLGGVNGVSAYHSNDISADEGLIGQAELRYRFNPNWMVSGFYEAGSVKVRHNPYTDADNTISLQGAGLGVYANYKKLNLESKVAWRTSDEKFSNDKRPRVWVKVGWDF